MNEPLHMPSCTAWITGTETDCDCTPSQPGWAIRKDTTVSLHAWRIFRRTRDNELLPMMRCSSFNHAVAMVSALIRVRTQASGDHHSAY